MFLLLRSLNKDSTFLSLKEYYRGRRVCHEELRPLVEEVPISGGCEVGEGFSSTARVSFLLG